MASAPDRQRQRLAVTSLIFASSDESMIAASHVRVSSGVSVAVPENIDFSLLVVTRSDALI